MKALLDFIPLVFFFVFFKFYDIYAGVTALMITSTIALAITWLLYKKIEKVALFGFFMVIGFGALTLLFKSDLFIKWKVTIVYLVFAAILIGSQLFFKDPAIKKLLGKELNVDNTIWKKVNLIWALFFILCGAINLYIAYQFSQATWVNFKTFMLPCVTLIFTLASGFYLYKNHQPTPEDTKAEHK